MNQYDHLRKNLKSYTVPVDKDKLWANTAHAIPQKRKRRGAFFLLFAGILLVSSGIMRYAFSGAENNAQKNNTHAEQSNVVSAAEVKSNNTINNTIASNQNSTSQPVTIADSKSYKQNNSTPSTHPFDHNVKSKKAENPLTSISSNTSAKPNQSSGNTTSKSVASHGPSSFVTGHDPMDDDSYANYTADISMLAEATYDAVRNGPYSTDEINALPITMLPYTPGDYSPVHPTSIKAKNKPSVNILLLQGYGWSTLDMATSEDELQPTVDLWEGKMKSLENLSTTLHATIRLPKGIYIGGGFQYNKLTSQLEYLETSNDDYTTQGVTAIVIGEDGSVENLYGDVNVTRQVITKATRYTSHDRLDVEAIVGIPVYRSYRFETNVWVTAGYNLLYQSDGTTFAPGDEPVKFSANENIYTLKSPITFGAGIGAQYRSSPHWTFHARLGYEGLRYTHGLYDDLISFHHHILSLSLGAGYIIQ